MELPPQSLCQRQLPDVLHLSLLQHLTLAGSLGQPLLMVVPFEAAQLAVVMQTPAIPFGP
jgi:hypothetical protein